MDPLLPLAPLVASGVAITMRGLSSMRENDVFLLAWRARPGLRAKWPWLELDAETVPETHLCEEFQTAARSGG